MGYSMKSVSYTKTTYVDGVLDFHNGIDDFSSLLRELGVPHYCYDSEKKISIPNIHYKKLLQRFKEKYVRTNTIPPGRCFEGYTADGIYKVLHKSYHGRSRQMKGKYDEVILEWS